MRYITLALSFFLLLTLVSPEFHPHPPHAEAAIFTVTSLANSGPGSLRQALLDANGAAGADEINFSVAGTIILSSELSVGGDLTINGSGITLDGGGTTRIMTVTTGTVIINNLTFQNGQADFGGAIYNVGTPVITGSTFSGNSATTSGGAIFNDGTSSITNSTFSGNSANFGGAISNFSTLEITNNTFSGNSAGTWGGAIRNNGPLEITNSTFSGNSATSGGAIFNDGTSSITNNTFSGNSATDGGTLHNLGTIAVASSLIVGGGCGGVITDGGHNLNSNAPGCPTPEGDPQLGPLQNNGGPTNTMLPALTGPAVDAYAAPCATTTDQRGINRPQGSLCDIGATEQASLVALTASAACNGPNLAVTITAGDGPFNITASAGVNTPVNGVNTGTTSINGPEKWDDVTVTETMGDLQSTNLGQFRCRSSEVAVPVSPAHRARTTNPFPTFSWTGISIANNYRVFVFDDANPATRTVDIRQNTGGPTSMTLSTPLPNGRLFWRVRGRQNRLWSLWSIRFTLFKDPPPPLTITTPVPTIDLGPPTGDDGVPSPAPTFPAPPNSR